jgi:hypothetical protein
VEKEVGLSAMWQHMASIGRKKGALLAVGCPLCHNR